MKKTSLFKRAIAVFISVLMVITSLPFTAITAFADDDYQGDPHLIAHFFDPNVSAKSVTKNYGAGADLSAVSENALVWNYTENAAEFKGSKTETPMVNLKDLVSSASNATGFTITFDAKTSMSNKWSRYFEFSVGDPYGDANGNVTYLYASPCNADNNLPHDDGFAKVKYTGLNNNESNGAIINNNGNAWHSYKIVIGGNQLFTFVDGKLTGSVNDSSRINDNFFNELINNGHLMLGASSYSSDSAFVGYIRNFMIVDMATLDIAMAAYEAKMKSGVMNNMKPAYEAYVLAKKAAEALTYGDFESYQNVEQIAADLTTKTNAMTAWTPKTGNATAPADNSYNKNSLKVDTNNGINDKMSNVLYAAGVKDVPWTNNTLQVVVAYATLRDYYNYTGLQYGSMVFLYDGRNDCANIVGAYSDKNGTRTASEGGLRNIYPKTSGFEVKTNWHGSSSLNSKDYSASNYIFGPLNGKYAHIGSAKGNVYHYGTLYYTGTPTKTVTQFDTLTWNVNTYSSNDKYDNKTGELEFGNKNNTGGSTTIYVIDYNQLADKIEDFYDTYFKNIGDYTQGQLSSMMEKVNSATAFDPNDSKYNYGSNLANAVSTCGADIDRHMENLKDLTATKDAFFTITAKKDSETLATFKLSNGCKANTVKCALGMVTPGNGQEETYHYDYVWPNTEDVTANKTYSVSRVTENHDWVSIDGTVIPETCETDGQMMQKCSKCAYEKKTPTVILATGHDYGDFIADWTEYDKDVKIYTHTKYCSHSDDGCETPTVQENCDFSAWNNNGDGTESRTCSGCNSTQTREKEADQLGYSFVLPNGTVVAEGSVAEGQSVDAPSFDGLKKSDLYNAAGHHSYSWDSTSYEITQDGMIITANDSVTQHTQDEKNINFTNVDKDTLLATSCDTKLSYSYDVVTYCTDEACGYVISTVNTPVDALSHTEVKQQNDGDTHNIKCSVCFATLRSEAHGDYTTVTTKPTCLAQGYTTFTCACGYSYNGNFTAKVDHSFGGFISNNDGTHSQICSVCGFDDKYECNIQASKVNATCTSPSSWQTRCNVCGYSAGELTRIDVTKYGNNALPNNLPLGSKGGSAKTQTYKFEASNGMKVSKLYVHLNAYANSNSCQLTVRQNDGVSDSNSSYGTKVYEINNKWGTYDKVIEINGDGFELWWNNKWTNDQEYVSILSVEADIVNDPALGHDYSKYVINDDFDANGLLGTHSLLCSRCDKVESTSAHNIKTRINANSDVEAYCETCGFSKVIYNKKSSFRITTGNLFDFKELVKSTVSADQPNNGTAQYNSVDDSITITGIGDNHTGYPNAQGDDTYRIPVDDAEYVFEYKATTPYARPMIFVPNADGYGSDSAYYGSLDFQVNTTKDPETGLYNCRFTVDLRDSGKPFIFFRFGTNAAPEGAQAFTTIYDISFYKNDGSYGVLNETAAPLSSFNDATASETVSDNIANFCKWNYVGTAITISNINVDPILHSFSVSKHTDADEENNGYTDYYCANKCGTFDEELRVYDTQDWAAYDAQVAVANDNANNAAKYTAGSRAEYQSAVDEITSTVKKTDVTKSQAYIDNKVDAIDDCKEKLVLMQYQIEFSYEIDGVPTTVSSKSYDYGSEIEMTVPSDVDGTVYKWTKTIGGIDSTMSTVSRTTTYYVGGSDASVIAYLVKVEKETTADNHIVKMYSFNNRVIDSKVVINDGRIDITSMNQNAVVFYDITGYTVNGETVDLETAKSYTVTGDLEIKPIYTPKNDDRVVITLDGDAAIGKQVGGEYIAAWDAKLTVKGTNTTDNTVWKVDGKVVGYGATYTFRATQSCTITYENDATVDGVSALNYLDYGKYLDHAITVVGSYDVPAGATNVRAGVFLKTVKNPTDRSKQLTFEEITTGNTTGKKYAEVFTDTDQYKIVITRTANTPILIGAVAFVEYELDGNPVVKYSAPQTIFGEN